MLNKATLMTDGPLNYKHIAFGGLLFIDQIFWSFNISDGQGVNLNYRYMGLSVQILEFKFKRS